MLATCIVGSSHAFSIMAFVRLSVTVWVNVSVCGFHAKDMVVWEGDSAMGIQILEIFLVYASFIFFICVLSISFTFSIFFTFLISQFAQSSEENPFTYKLLNILLICYCYQLMNFETSEPFDQQLGRLLAIVIMCEKNIEEVRKKLAGNEQFHTRLVFDRMDFRKKGEVTPEDIVYTLAKPQRGVTLINCQNLCRKYTISGAFIYEEQKYHKLRLLALLVPKTDKSLSQRMLIRMTKRGSTLPNYLWKHFCELLISIISMTAITEEIRKRMQNCADLNYLQMVQFFKSRLKSEHTLWKFCNVSSDEQYDFSPAQVKYLSNHIRSVNPLRQMTDEDIKQLICPLDMNFQKTVHEMAPYFQNIKIERQRTQNGAFFKQVKHDQKVRITTQTNFLKTSYQPFFLNTQKQKQNTAYNRNEAAKQSQRNWLKNEPAINIRPVLQADDMILKPSRILQGSQMYLDNFIKPLSYPYENANQYSHSYQYGNRNQQGNNAYGKHNGYIGGGAYGVIRDGYQRFEDQLPQNLSSQHSNSAFVQY